MDNIVIVMALGALMWALLISGVGIATLAIAPAFLVACAVHEDRIAEEAAKIDERAGYE